MEVLTRRMADGSTVIGWFNRGSEPATASVDWKTLYIPAGSKVRDLWKHEALPVNGPSYQATVPTHGVMLLRVTP